MSAVEVGRDEAERDARFQNLVQNLYGEECAMMDIIDAEGINLVTRVNCDLYTPLYEMNKNYHWPRRRHLQQGVAALPGLPEWGYSMFTLVAPWDTRPKDSFTYRGEEVTFMGVEYDLAVPARIDTECDSPSEFDYEFDESGWAT
jgi:hypothetical protein